MQLEEVAVVNFVWVFAAAAAGVFVAEADAAGDLDGEEWLLGA